MSRPKETVILKLKEPLSSEDYKKLYFNLRRQIWSNVMILPPDIDLVGVTDTDADLVLITKENDILSSAKEVSG